MWLGNIKFPEFWAPVGWESCLQKYHPYCFFGSSFLTLSLRMLNSISTHHFHVQTQTHPTMSPAVHGLCDCETRMWSPGLRLKSPQFFHAESSPLRLLCDPRQSLSLSEPVSSSIKLSLIIHEVLLFQLVIYWDLQTTHFRTYCIHFKVNSVWSLWLCLHEKTSNPPPAPQRITSFKKQGPVGRRAETQQPLALTLWESMMGWPYTWNFQLSVSRQNDVSYNHARQPEVQGKVLTPHKWHIISGRNLALIKSPFCS